MTTVHEYWYGRGSANNKILKITIIQFHPYTYHGVYTIYNIHGCVDQRYPSTGGGTCGATPFLGSLYQVHGWGKQIYLSTVGGTCGRGATNLLGSLYQVHGWGKQRYPSTGGGTYGATNLLGSLYQVHGWGKQRDIHPLEVVLVEPTLSWGPYQV